MPIGRGFNPRPLRREERRRHPRCGFLLMLWFQSTPPSGERSDGGCASHPMKRKSFNPRPPPERGATRAGHQRGGAVVRWFQSTPPSGERSDLPTSSLHRHRQPVSIHAPLRREERRWQGIRVRRFAEVSIHAPLRREERHQVVGSQTVLTSEVSIHAPLRREERPLDSRTSLMGSAMVSIHAPLRREERRAAHSTQ